MSSVGWPRFVLGTDPWFVSTGDIPDMWIRDATVTVLPYLANVSYRRMLDGTLRRSAFYLLEDVYANSYRQAKKKPTESEEPWVGGFAPWRGVSRWVATRNYELDSGCYFFRLWRALDYMDDDAVVSAAMHVLRTWSVERAHDEARYTHPELTAQQVRVNRSSGLTWSGFRPSDDRVTYGYHIPSQFFVLAELAPLARAMRTRGRTAMSDLADDLATTIATGLREHATTLDPHFGRIYCYEIDALGGCNKMDDANIPSLLALPIFAKGFYDEDTYARTRRFVLSDANPYFYRGVYTGIGSPHTPRQHIWPMAMIAQAMTDEDDRRVLMPVLTRLRAQWPNGFVESFHKDRPSRYTRVWFEWPNALWTELVRTETTKPRLVGAPPPPPSPLPPSHKYLSVPHAAFALLLSAMVFFGMRRRRRGRSAPLLHRQ